MKYHSPRFACDNVDDITIGVHASEAPTDEDWAAWLKLVGEVLEAMGSCRVLVYGLGGGPNSAQRSQVNELFKDRPQKVSVMIDSRIARGAVTALSWFNPGIKAFGLDQLDGACAHLGISDAQRDLVRATMERMRKELVQPGG